MKEHTIVSTFAYYNCFRKMNSAVYLLCVVLCIVEYQCTRSDAMELSQRLLDAIRYVETRGDVCTLGDSASGMMSLGAYQITRDYYNEAVEANATLSDHGEGMIGLLDIACCYSSDHGRRLVSDTSTLSIAIEAKLTLWVSGILRCRRDRKQLLLYKASSPLTKHQVIYIQ